MKYWKDLTPQEQSEYSEGIVSLYGFDWKCYYKFIKEDEIEIFCKYNDWGQSFTHYKSLVGCRLLPRHFNLGG